MRRGFLALVLLLPFIATASAQSPTPRTVQTFRIAAPALVASASLETVVDRLMVFDRNRDGRVAKDELLERMQPLVTRGDANGDGALDDVEIRTLATTRPAATIRGGVQPGTYGFADQTGLSTRSHIEDSIDDLRLPAATRDQALAVVKSFTDTLQVSAAATLQKEMKSVLSAEQLADFKVVFDRQRRSGVAPAPIGGDSHATLVERNLTMVVFASDLERRVVSYKLASVDLHRAQAALQQYRSTLRLGDTERSALMAQLTNVLNDEERDNLAAALKRRPVVKTGNVVRVAFAADLRKVQADIAHFQTLPTTALPVFRLIDTPPGVLPVAVRVP